MIYFSFLSAVALSRQLWLIILCWRYPWLKRTNVHGIKSFVDRTRNPEVLCVLMEMEGKFVVMREFRLPKCDKPIGVFCFFLCYSLGEIDVVQLRDEFLHHIRDCSSSHMRLCLPQFILPFMSCWNKYPWLKG